MVKAFSERDILDSIEIRGTLEGLAARFAAERGVSVRDLTPLKENLAELDVLMRREPLSVEVFLAHVSLNARFHALLSDLSGSAPLVRQIERVSALPFASPSGFVMAQSALAETRQILQIAQDHHHVVIDAIENREGARAEAVCTSMRGSQRATYGLRCATVPISSCCRRWRWCVRRLRAFRSENCSSWRGVRPRPERAMRDGLILRDTATVRSSG
jgi:DNA-binding GntR family transcriptional regulator